MSTHRMIVPDGAVLGSAPSVAASATGSHAAGGNPFLDAMLEMPTTNAHTSRSPLKMAASVAIHAAVIALLIIVPIYFATNTVDLQKYTPTYVFTQPVHLAPPPPPAAARAPQTAVRTPQITPAFVAPRVIPKVISQAPANNANVAAPDLNAGVIGGVPGGVAGGVLGGVLGGTGPVGPPPPTIAPGIVRVGGNVRPPELLQRVPPDYPAIARAAHVQGTVVIDAVIDTTGNVVSEHAISGPNLLIPAALSAVEQWKYQPTYLNGKPVKLAMQVTVSFNLG